MQGDTRAEKFHMKACIEFLRRRLAFWGFKGDDTIVHVIPRFLNFLSLEALKIHLDIPTEMKLRRSYKEYLISCEYCSDGTFNVLRPCKLSVEELVDYRNKIGKMLHKYMFYKGGSRFFDPTMRPEVFDLDSSDPSDIDEDLFEHHKKIWERKPKKSKKVKKEVEDEDEIQVLRHIRPPVYRPARRVPVPAERGYGPLAPSRWRRALDPIEEQARRARRAAVHAERRRYEDEIFKDDEIVVGGESCYDTSDSENNELLDETMEEENDEVLQEENAEAVQDQNAEAIDEQNAEAIDEQNANVDANANAEGNIDDTSDSEAAVQ